MIQLSMIKKLLKRWTSASLKPYKNSTLTDVDSIASNFDNHRSFNKLQECFPDIDYAGFDFTKVSWEDVKKEILNLNAKNFQLMVRF